MSSPPSCDEDICCIVCIPGDRSKVLASDKTCGGTAPENRKGVVKRTVLALITVVVFGTTGSAATAPNATGITYAGIHCVTARETAAIVCTRVKGGGYTVSVSKGFITVWRNGGDYRMVYQRRNR